MSATPEITGVDPQELTDQNAVLRHALHGEQIEPEIARRVQERAAHVTAEIRRLHGDIDTETIVALFRDDDE